MAIPNDFADDACDILEYWMNVRFTTGYINELISKYPPLKTALEDYPGYIDSDLRELLMDAVGLVLVNRSPPLPGDFEYAALFYSDLWHKAKQIGFET